ncbi:30S ribosomal protein S6 [Acetohalobium arabaticum]|uniref:Small ribosomal subunit protein bS6 n=1 Tax=Acetohalobium arabaticum (strain ATCC 49924 / DSM 5501 / Z-7288) TaxID=574087 RepID=D9QUL2_ACEAZ|nr:30S ribosomal protein S6 [Acetohalobium arabaticum]ADL13813.1 ribosomal protein S6 [Acetohalobium arabaticum DSM 5501]
MRKYETMFIVNPDLEDDATEEIVEKITDTIDENKGEISNIDKWGTKNLAYELDDHKAGYYTVVNFEGESETIDELERAYRLDDNILRFIILRDEQ